MDERDLWHTWASFLRPFGASDEILETWRARVTAQYRGAPRHYHTLRHICHMLSLMTEHLARIRNDIAVFLAIIFHDVVYDPKATDNEERSVEMFGQFAEDIKLPTPLRDEICDMIIKTKTHQTDVHTTPGLFGTTDCDYFLDFDMGILGASPQDYSVYAEQIRLEYHHIPCEIYKAKRSEVLKGFLKLTNLFATAEMRKQMEERARGNIRAEINSLGASTLV